MRKIIELGIWDIWERASLFALWNHRGILPAEVRGDGGGKNSISISAYACKHTFIFTHSLSLAQPHARWILCMHFPARLFPQSRAPSRGWRASVLDGMLLHPWSVRTPSRAVEQHLHIQSSVLWPLQRGGTFLLSSRVQRDSTVYPAGLTCVALMAVWCDGIS